MRLCIQGERFEALAIYADNIPFHRVRSDTLTHEYVPDAPSDERTDAQQDAPAGSSPICIRALNTLDGFLPAVIHVNGVRFQKRIGATFTQEPLSVRGVERYFDVIAKDYDMTVSVDLNARVYGLLLNRLGKVLPPGPIHLLDVGVGTGTALKRALLERISSAFRLRLELTATDLSRMMVSYATAELGVGVGGMHVRHIGKCAYAQLAIADASVDAVTACFVVHYFADGRPFHEIHRVLRSGGWVAFNLHEPRTKGEREGQREAPRRRRGGPRSLQPYELHDYVVALRDAGFTGITGEATQVRCRNELGDLEDRRIRMIWARVP